MPPRIARICTDMGADILRKSAGAAGDMFGGGSSAAFLRGEDTKIWFCLMSRNMGRSILKLSLALFQVDSKIEYDKQYYRQRDNN